MEITLTKENFEAEVLKSEIPVIIDFWASWCGPCMMLGPVIAEIAEENQGKIKVCKCNVDEQGELAQQFGIISIPTVISFKDGQQYKMSVGFVPKEKIMELVG